MKGTNSRKGHQGFTAKYPTLGDTKLVRIPVTISQDIKVIVLLLEGIAQEKGVDKVSEILDNITDKLGDRLP